MVQTKGGVSSNPWVKFMRKCAKEYESSKQPATEQAKGGHDTKHAKGATGGKHTKGPTGGKHTAMTKEEETVKGWKDRQQEVYKKQSHANMKRSGEIARKAEQDHLVRKRLTTKQKENHLVRKRLTTKQKEN